MADLVLEVQKHGNVTETLTSIDADTAINASAAVLNNMTSTISSTATRDEAWERGLFNLAEAVSFSVAIGVMVIFGLVANLLTIAAIVKSRKLRSSPFNVMIISLCVSDLISTANSPFVLYWKTWGVFEFNLPLCFCKSTLSIDIWTNAVTIQHILVFISIRLLAVKYPRRMKDFTLRKSKIAIFVIWVEAGVVNLGAMAWSLHKYPSGSLSPTGKSCSVYGPKSPTLRMFTYITWPLYFYLPTLIIVILTFVLVRILIKRRSLKQQAKKIDASIRKETGALVQLSFIVASFLIGYLPDFGYRLTMVITSLLGIKFYGRGPWLFSITSHVFVRISECLNPIFYNLGSSQMRKATKDLLGIEDNKRSTSTPIETKSKKKENIETSIPISSSKDKTRL
uniref:melanin-concentrating hormone receptor 2-like n=1 Tax=Styela clava TaxID=7725 RepID=UPI0019395551|nr:melanin-concentrating hormone receptor 2-like [Styela clava]